MIAGSTSQANAVPARVFADDASGREPSASTVAPIRREPSFFDGSFNGEKLSMGATSSSVSSTNSTTARYARLALIVVLALLAWSAFHDEYGTVPFVSDVDLAIHEFGHMLFLPFGIAILGRTMFILGGSLTQVAFPLVFVAYFMRQSPQKRRDVFSAMVCLWWSGINLLDVAIYCADSRAGRLMLLDGLTGQESDGHDWYNLLDGWGWLEHDTVIARWMRAVAWLMCTASLIVAVWSALRSEDANA